eukprot:m.900224 g.900224  ORF g.900224 m.900224 type:complete len:146 (-) comp23684_c0_seq32:292-729(-)
MAGAVSILLSSDTKFLSGMVGVWLGCPATKYRRQCIAICHVQSRCVEQVTASAYLQLSATEHCWGLLGGFVWSTGTIANLLSGDELGYAVSYAIGQSAPVVATLWGLLYYKEFAGCSYTVLTLLGLMFLFYGGAVAVIALGGDGA